MTVQNGSRIGWLAGPYNCRAFADEATPAAKNAAGGDTKDAWWYAYGVTRIRDADAPKRVVFPHL